MPFGFINAPATFQSYIDDCLRPYIVDFAMRYLVNTLFYLNNEKEHDKHIWKVLERLRKFGLYCKAEKCQFGVSVLRVLGFIISPEGVCMESDQISKIEDSPTPKSVRDVLVPLGFANFYLGFIRKYAKVILPLTELLKSKAPGGKKSSRFLEEATTQSQPMTKKWKWTREAELSFHKLKMAFTNEPLLKHFDPAKPIILQTNSSGFAIAGILTQYDGLGTL